MEPFSNENQTSSSLQRILIGIGTLIVVLLTVIAAIFLARQQTPNNGVPPIVQITPSPTAITVTSTRPSLPSLTPTSTPTTPPTDTPTATSLPPVETTEIPPTPSDTPVPPEPTLTFTPVVIIITATPLPAATPSEATCPFPPNWVAYTVQTGDTLNTLASRTGTSVFDLQQANCLASSTIQPRQVIYLPFTPPPVPDTPTSSPTSTARPNPSRTPTVVAPVINSVVPNNVDEEANKQNVIITVIGRNFRPTESGFKVELRGPQSLELQLGETRSDTSFDAIVPPNLPRGTYDLVVTNPSDRAGIRESAFTIGPAAATSTPAASPRIISVSPQMGQVSDDITLIVDGTDFRPNEAGFKVELVLGSTVIELTEFVEPGTDRTFKVKIQPNTLEPGEYDLVVTNPDGRSDTEENAYEAKE